MSASLSIAIPIYNEDISDLVSSLQIQLSNLSADIEILLADDGSAESIRLNNRQFADMEGITYREQAKNMGRAAIRNFLAGMSSKTHLLFLDGDTLIKKDDFIATYLDLINDSPASVICGGRDYPISPPSTEFLLHWTYGRERESKTAYERQQQPYRSFHSNNFIIPRAVWRKIPFDEKFLQYGHEDTLLAYRLMQEDIELLHVENATIHGQLDSNEDFLQKTKLALQNLKSLYERNDQSLVAWNTMLHKYHKIRRLGLKAILGFLYRFQQKTWEAKLVDSNSIPLRIFDLYRISYLCSL